MKLKLIYFAVLAVGFTAFMGMIRLGAQSSETISGTWKEVKWEYEKCDCLYEEIDTDTIRLKGISTLNEKIGQRMFVHENETWTFSPDGKLLLHDDDTDSDAFLNWVLKGRGNILVLKKGDQALESYNVTQLDDETMILNFNLDLQARGIAKLTFKKISS